MSYWEKAYNRLKRFGKITTFEIIECTNTTCPHSVIRDIKKHGAELRIEDAENNGKKYRIYYLIKPILAEQLKIEPQQPTAEQMGLGLIVEKTKMTYSEMRLKYNV